MTAGAIPQTRPTLAAQLTSIGQTLMDVILHLGAHRTGTTTFQHYVRNHRDALQANRIGFWGPTRMRKSVLPGMFDVIARVQPRRAHKRIRMLTAQAEAQGVEKLLVSDENMLGTCSLCFRHAALYPTASERLARLGAAFGGRVTRVVLSIRAQDLWWASASALTAARGHRVQGPERYDRIAQDPRSWRDVITDLACALPGADICVMPFETFAGRPERMLQEATDLALPPDNQLRWLNRSLTLPDLRAVLTDQGSDPTLLPRGQGRWQPFTPEQAMMLREAYADDKHWLAAGAEGLARLIEDDTRTRADIDPPHGARFTEGHGDEQGHMAQNR